jgi:hypothetical protein
MKTQEEYLRDAAEFGMLADNLHGHPNDRVRSIAAVLWQAAREARTDEHLHYCALCRHGKPCSRITKIRKGLS